MRKIQTQGVHHITINGANRQTAIDFWEGVLGMPFVFEQPNLDNAGESHLYFDPGDGRLITVFTKEERQPDANPTPREPGFVHHLAFSLSQAMFAQTVERLDERGIEHSGVDLFPQTSVSSKSSPAARTKMRVVMLLTLGLRMFSVVVAM